MKKVIARAVAIVVVGIVASIGMVGAPASADPADIQLSSGTLSPLYLVNGCRYKIIYANYGSAPVAGINAYGGCTSVNVGILSADGLGGAQWSNSSNPSGTGSDACGAYTYYLVTGQTPGYGIGAWALINGASGGTFWKIYGYDGTQTQPIHSTC